MTREQSAPLQLHHVHKKGTLHPGRLKRFMQDVTAHTPIKRLVIIMVLLWLAFSTVIWLVERNASGAAIVSIIDALYWGVAAFSTAGIADTPTTATAKIIGGLWIVVGSALFFGTIVATITTYFMRPMQRPHHMIINTIEYNLEQLDDLNLEEIDLLRDTVEVLLVHVEQLKEQRAT